MYVSRLAWLNAELSDDAVKGQRRSELLSDHNPHKTLPEIDGLDHIITYLLELGLYESGGMGMSQISWCAIESWQRLTGTQITADEARLIRKLSFIYISQYTKSKDMNESAPFPDEAYLAIHAADKRDKKEHDRHIHARTESGHERHRPRGRPSR